MYEGDIATLQMQNLLLEQASFDQRVYRCRILQHEKGSEHIHLILEDGILPEMILDAVYECRIMNQAAPVACKGMIKDRCLSEHGQVLHFRIEAGFYEINIK